MTVGARPVSAQEAIETFKAYVSALERNEEKSAMLVATVRDLSELGGAEPEGVREQLTSSEVGKAEAMYARLYDALVGQNDFLGAASFHNQVTAFLDGEAKRLEGQRNPGVLSQRVATRLVESLERQPVVPAPPSAAPTAASGAEAPPKDGPESAPGTVAQADATEPPRAPGTDAAVARALAKWAARGDVFFETERVMGLVDRAVAAVAQSGEVAFDNASRLGSGAELRAVIEVLGILGYEVTSTESAPYRRINRIEVRAKGE